jgi:hypothetical protein
MVGMGPIHKRASIQCEYIRGVGRLVTFMYARPAKTTSPSQT